MVYTLTEVSKRPTIADVARLCGVTAATVSRVLNNNQNFSTTEAVRKKIRDTARDLGYMPDIGARNLSLRSSRIVGLFSSPHIHIAEGINEALIDGITETLHAGGFDVFYGLGRRRATKNRVPDWRFDGAVLLQAPRPEAVEELDSRHVPYVCVNDRIGTPAAFVLADEQMGTKSAIMHLLDLGHERIAYANAMSSYYLHYSNDERYATILAEARKGNFTLVPGHNELFHADAASKFLRTMVLEGGATAVIAYDHQIAFMILGASHAMGLRIPQDFSLICFNDVFPTAIVYPSLTCVAVPGREMGRIAAELLLKNIGSKKRIAGREIRVAEHLIVRSSTTTMQKSGRAVSLSPPIP
jgi:LacI family transcriptional regulator